MRVYGALPLKAGRVTKQLRPHSEGSRLFFFCLALGVNVTRVHSMSSEKKIQPEGNARARTKRASCIPLQPASSVLMFLMALSESLALTGHFEPTRPASRRHPIPARMRGQCRWQLPVSWLGTVCPKYFVSLKGASVTKLPLQEGQHGSPPLLQPTYHFPLSRTSPVCRSVVALDAADSLQEVIWHNNVEIVCSCQVHSHFTSCSVRRSNPDSRKKHSLPPAHLAYACGRCRADFAAVSHHGCEPPWAVADRADANQQERLERKTLLLFQPVQRFSAV